MRLRAAFFLASLGLTVAAFAQIDAKTPIKFARQPSLSPDGKTIAFSYLGDIWTVPASGGNASRLTIHEAHDQLPVWSPDGKWIAFSSKREGNYDVFIIPAEGGRAKQLTFHSADDNVNAWSPDGKSILFASNRETTRTTSLYTVDVKTSATLLVAREEFPLNNASFTPNGSKILTTRGGFWTRHGYRGSQNGRLMQYPVSGGAGNWYYRDEANSRWPLASADGKTCWFVSDNNKERIANLVKKPMDGGKPVQVTKFHAGNIFYPTLAKDGSRLVFEHDFGLWTLDTKTGDPKALTIYAPSDDRANTLRRETFRTGVQEMQVSPDGKQIAFVIRGDIFVQLVSGGDTVRITDTTQRDREVTWTPDSKTLLFVSDRSSDNLLYSADIKTKTTKQLTKDAGKIDGNPVVSPDGKTVAFVRGYNGEELCVMPMAGGEIKTLVRDPHISPFVWSPDSKWIAYQRMKSHSAGTLADIFLVSPTEAKPVNVTRYPGVNGDPKWSKDSTKLFFLSDRTGNTNVWSVSLVPEKDKDDDKKDSDAAKPTKTETKTEPKVPVDVKIDWTDIHKRAKQVTRVEPNVSNFAISPDGKTVVFALAQLGRPDLWKISAEGGDAPTRLTQSGETGTGLQFAPDGSKVYYAQGGIRSLGITPPAPAPTPVAFAAKMDIDTPLELREMFDESWRTMRDAFYDEKMHGADWNAVKARYRPIVDFLTYKEDFYVLFALVLGELNASHTGLSGAPTDTRATASLGITLDETYTGAGVKVKTVVPKGPADKDESRLAPGDVILKIDGDSVGANENYYALLADKANKRVELTVSKDGKLDGAKTVKVRAVTQAEHKRLDYDKWHAEREAMTAKTSNNRLGYLHLTAMDDPNLEKFKRAVYGDMQEKDGMILDLRFNGGGSIADEIMAVIEAKVFSYRSLRGDKEKTTAPLSAWNKPMIVLINEGSFSNAEVFPWGFKDLKLGKVVGVPTAGGVIGTGGTTIIDGSTLRLPAVGSYTLTGINMENNGCPPDIYVENTPDDVFQNHDRQLETAATELMKQVKK